MKRKRKVYLGTGIAAALALAALFLAGGGKEVETVQARRADITRTVTDTGYVQAAESCDLHAPQSARVALVLVETGEPVKQGQTLLVLENLDLAVQLSEVRSELSQAAGAAAGARAAVERTRLELDDATQNLSRVEELFQAGAVARAEYDRARLQVETLRQTLSGQESALDGALALQAGLARSLEQLSAKERQLTVKSPLDGTVIDLPVKQEQVLAPGALMASVAAPGLLEVRADILSDDLAEVRVGQKVVIAAPVLGQRTLTGEVKKIYPRAEEKQSALGIIQRRVPVIVGLEDPANLKPGYEVKVSIETRSRQDVLVLPREAVRTAKDGQKEVMAVVDGRARRRVVQTGLSDRENVEIVDGLAPGDYVVRDGSLDMAEGTKIKTLDKR
ncbi:MAG TPA: efflux RND transporter periplasmic adaptor subunit [Bacillota bacterium]|nr:efflux RND transporter periplasmic adaptor subunit [Bacillota bacterium]